MAVGIDLVQAIAKKNALKYGTIGLDHVETTPTNDGLRFVMKDLVTFYDIPLTTLAFVLKTELSDSVSLNDSQIPSSSKATYLLNQIIQATQTDLTTNYIKNDKMTSVITGDSTTLVATQKAVNELFKLINFVTTGMAYIGAISNQAFNLLTHGESGNIYKAIEQITLGAVIVPQNALIIFKNDFDNRIATANDFDYFVGSESLHNLLDGLQGGNSVDNKFYHSDQPINKTDTVTFATVNTTTLNATTATIPTMTSTTGNITTVNATSGNFGSIKAGIDAPVIKMKKLTGTLNGVGAHTDITHGLDMTKILSFTAIAYNTDNRWVTMDATYDTNSIFTGSMMATLFRLRNDGSKLIGRQVKILVTYEA